MDHILSLALEVSQTHILGAISHYVVNDPVYVVMVWSHLEPKKSCLSGCVLALGPVICSRVSHKNLGFLLFVGHPVFEYDWLNEFIWTWNGLGMDLEWTWTWAGHYHFNFQILFNHCSFSLFKLGWSWRDFLQEKQSHLICVSRDEWKSILRT